MRFCQGLRMACLPLLLGASSWAAGPVAAAVTPPPAVSLSSATETAPAIALSHRAKQLMEALLQGDAEALRAAQLEVEALRRTYSTLDVAPLVEAICLWSRQQGLNGKPGLGLEGLQAVERWSPEHPTLLGTRISLLRQQGLQGWFWSYPDLLRLTRLRLEHSAHRWLWVVQHLGMLRLGATLLLWGWALTMGLRYRNVLRNIWEEPLRHKRVAPLLAALIGALVLAGPVILGLDPMVAAMVWLFLLAPFLTPTEVRVTSFILILQLVHPALAALEPWASRST